MVPDSNTWKPPVQFHFRVDFQWKTGKASASFTEVDGLGQEIVLDGKPVKSDNTPGYPQSVKPEDIVLKRAIEPLDEQITSWLRNSFNFRDTGWIDTCTVIISLLDEKNKITARWACVRAIPIKWKVSGLNAVKSDIVVETITLRHTKLIRNI